MGDLWLPDLADWLRAGGLDVVEFNDGRTGNWRTLSRSSGGYDSILAIGLHHDASAPGRTGKQAAEAHYRNHENAPVGALSLDRAGVWWVGAAGATNTQGKGGPLVCSRGTIPLDAGNRHTISIEAANDGVGEPWRQLDSYVRGVAAIIRGLADDGAYNARTRRYERVVLDPLHPGDVHAHFDWAPTRKIDPAGGLGQYPYAEQNDRYLRWDMGRFRADVAAWLKPHDLPPEDDMANVAKIRFKGYADQYALIPLGPDTNHRLGLEDQAPLVVSGPGRSQIEGAVGYTLTPMPGE